MTRTETASVLAYMGEVWPNSKEASAKTLDVWFDLLGDLPFQAVQKAIRGLAMTHGPFAPGVADIRRAAMGSRFPTPIEAYGQAMEALDTLFIYSDGYECEGMKLMHPLARKALELFGIRELNDADPTFARPQFMKAYESLLARAEEDAALPLSFKQEIEALRSGQPALPENVQKARDLIAAVAAGKGM
jgi:hypothetical protein